MMLSSQALHGQSAISTVTPPEPGELGRPSLLWSDLWRAPLHDFPIRDEILCQFLPLSREMDVLEVGPGSGFTAFWLARQVRRLTLVEIGTDSLTHLRKQLRSRSNVEYVQWDVSQPGLEKKLGKGFDAAFGLDVLEYVRDPGACLLNLASILRPDGKLVLSFPDTLPPAGDGVTYFQQKDEIETLLEQADFRSWEICAVRLRADAAAVYKVSHDWPLRLYRYWQASARSPRPQIYDRTWAFQHRGQLERLKVPLNLFWMVLGKLMRVRGNAFVKLPASNGILGRQVVIQARR